MSYKDKKEDKNNMKTIELSTPDFIETQLTTYYMERRLTPDIVHDPVRFEAWKQSKYIRDYLLQCKDNLER